MQKRKFRCTVDLSLDGKGRLRLPARLRASLEDDGEQELVVRSAGECICLYRPSYFEERVVARAGDFDPFSRRGQTFRRALLAGVEDVPWDRQGRLRIPAWMREEAAVGADGEDGEAEGGRRCVFIWYGDDGELWNAERWRAVRRRALEAERAGELGD